MELKSIRIQNYKALQNIRLTDIPKFLVLVGANGSGKSSIFAVFGFLRDSLTGTRKRHFSWNFRENCPLRASPVWLLIV